MRRNILLLAMLALLLLSCPATASAQGPDPYRLGSIKITLKAQDTPVAGAKLNVYYVATSTAQSDGSFIYAYIEPMKDCGIALDDPELPRKLSAYVEENPLVPETVVTDEKGEIIIKDLPAGLYFVKQIGTVEGFTSCSPFLVTLPLVTNSEIIYDVDAAPKTDVSRLIPVTIKIIWKTPKSITIPDEMPVELLCGSQVVEKATLNPGNLWQVHYPELPERDDYNVRRLTLPKGFTATYTRNDKALSPVEPEAAADGARTLALTRAAEGQRGYTFIITITAGLAQTGQLMWPIPVLAAAGLLFLALGFVLLRKPGRRNA